MHLEFSPNSSFRLGGSKHRGKGPHSLSQCKSKSERSSEPYQAGPMSQMALFLHSLKRNGNHRLGTTALLENFWDPCNFPMIIIRATVTSW